jgi:hypothetical protein
MTRQPKENKKRWDMGKTRSDNKQCTTSGRTNNAKRMKEEKQERMKVRNGCLGETGNTSENTRKRVK